MCVLGRVCRPIGGRFTFFGWLAHPPTLCSRICRGGRRPDRRRHPIGIQPAPPRGCPPRSTPTGVPSTIQRCQRLGSPASGPSGDGMKTRAGKRSRGGRGDGGLPGRRRYQVPTRQGGASTINIWGAMFLILLLRRALDDPKWDMEDGHTPIPVPCAHGGFVHT